MKDGTLLFVRKVCKAELRHWLRQAPSRFERVSPASGSCYLGQLLGPLADWVVDMLNGWKGRGSWWHYGLYCEMSQIPSKASEATLKSIGGGPYPSRRASGRLTPPEIGGVLCHVLTANVASGCEVMSAEVDAHGGHLVLTE